MDNFVFLYQIKEDQYFVYGEETYAKAPQIAKTLVGKQDSDEEIVVMRKRSNGNLQLTLWNKNTKVRPVL